MKLSTGLRSYIIVMGMLLAAPVLALADDAPVYDVDNYPPQFDNSPSTPASAVTQHSPPPEAVRSSGAPAPAVVSDDADNSADDSAADDDQTTTAPSAASADSSLTPDQRVKRLEQQMNNLQQTDLSGKNKALETQVQSLRGQVEELTHQLQQSQAQQKAMYTELDKRLGQSSSTDHSSDVAVPTRKSSKSSTGLAPLAESNQKTAPPSATVINHDTQPNHEEEQKVYQKAYDLIKAKKYDAAISALQKMLKKYPSGQFAANAHYWLGELYGLVNKNDQAIVEFSTIVDHYPDNPKAADAQLKLGLIYVTQSKYPEAKVAFKKVTAKYPDTASSRLAVEQLKQLKQMQN